MNWYVIWTPFGHREYSLNKLTKRFKDKYELYVPTYHIKTLHATKVKYLHPAYIYIKCEYSYKLESILNKCFAGAMFLKVNNIPYALTDTEFENIQKTDNLYINNLNENSLKKEQLHQIVKIKDGPFVNMWGIVVNFDDKYTYVLCKYGKSCMRIPICD